MATKYLPFETLEAFMRDALHAAGVPRRDAELCADVLITADKLGIDSHGISRLKPIYIDRIDAGILRPVTEVELVRETATTAVFDAHDGMGMVAARAAMQRAIDAAAKYGTGMSVVRNSSHYGIAGYYALMASRAGMIGLSGTNARPSIAPTFGTENMLGTNPLTWAMPTDEEFPFFLDCATSITQRGKIEVYARQGSECAPGLVINSAGETLTDSAAILDALVSGDAALCPLGGPGENLGGYKGYGYATVVEILSAALSQGHFLKYLVGKDENGNKRPYSLGHFFVAFNIEAFTELDAFKKTAGEILRGLRASRKAPGAKRIFTAGEKEFEAFTARTKSGVPLDEGLQKEMRELNERFALGYSL